MGSGLRIQCGNCSFVCPHSVIRSKFYDAADQLAGAPTGSRSCRWTRADCPMPATPCRCTPRTALRVRAMRRGLPGVGARRFRPQGDQPGPCRITRGQREAQHRVLRDDPGQRPVAGRLRHGPAALQFLQPLFEFSGACSKRPALRDAVPLLVSQLFGDRLQIANATGCSSIYGGNLPTTPWTTDKGRAAGSAWSNSLFEDNAEFRAGPLRLAADQHFNLARHAALRRSSRTQAPDPADRSWPRRS